MFRLVEANIEWGKREKSNNLATYLLKPLLYKDDAKVRILPPPPE
jgi:hypothetical protein